MNKQHGTKTIGGMEGLVAGVTADGFGEKTGFCDKIGG
jgi:hypothetical protein